VRSGLLAGLFGKETKHVRAVDGISFDVKRGEVFCLVGESGCGKTTTGKGLIRLNEPTGGNIFFDAPEAEWNRFVAMERRLGEWLTGARLPEVLRVIQLVKTELSRRGVVLTWSVSQVEVEGPCPASKHEAGA